MGSWQTKCSFCAGRRRNYITETTYKLLLKHSDDFLGSLIEFCWETGCRPQEAWRLRPDHIQFQLQRCVIPKGLTKRNRGDRHIYCTDRAMQVLNERPAGFEYVFTNSRGTQWNKDNIGKRMDNLKKHVGRRYALYDIRHTWITNRVKKGIPIHMVAKLTCTSIAMIERFYDESDQDAKFMLEALIDSA
jgi:integrase